MAEKIKEHVYLHNGKRYVLAPGSYDPDDIQTVLDRIQANEREVARPPLKARKNQRRVELARAAEAARAAEIPQERLNRFTLRYLALLDERSNGPLSADEERELAGLRQKLGRIEALYAAQDRALEAIRQARSEADLDRIEFNPGQSRRESV